MSKFGKRHLALVLTITAVVVAGCGSSSSSRSGSKSPAASTPATPSTPATASTPTPAGLALSTPLSDPAVHALLVADTKRGGALPVTDAQLKQIVSCVIKKLQANGVKTYGELTQHTAETMAFAKQCTIQVTGK